MTSHCPAPRAALAGLLLALLPLALQARTPWVPLRVTVTPSQSALLATPNELRRATADTPRLTMTPIDFKVSITNISGAPLRLNTYDFTWSRLAFDVTGPDAHSVVVAYRPIERQLRAPQPADIITLAPDQTWQAPEALHFPSEMGALRYDLQAPGVYTVRARYVCALSAAERQGWAEDCWQGAIAAAPLALPVVLAGAPDHGLCAGLALQLNDVMHTPGPQLTVTLLLRNVGTAPLTVPAWEVQPHLGLTVSDPAHPDLPAQSVPANHRRELAPSERTVTLAPGAIQAVTWTGTLRAQPTTDGVPHTELCISDRTGNTYAWTLIGEQATLLATLAAPLPAVQEGKAAVPQWAGTANSLPASLTPDPTVARAALLQAHADEFVLALGCLEPADKPYYALQAQVAPLPALKKNNGFSLAVQLTTAEAVTLIEGLAKGGWLARSTGPLRQRETPPVSGYVCTLGAGPASWTIPLGWDATTCARLTELQALLPAAARPVMQPLLGRLTGLEKQWLAAAAPTQIVSMEATGLTHQEAVARLLEFLGKPAWTVPAQSADPAALYPTHTQFHQIPAGEIAKLLDRISR